jgi:hypothetical protein
MRYRLRTLMIVLAIGPLVLAGAWREYRLWKLERELSTRFSDSHIRRLWDELIENQFPIVDADLGPQSEYIP